MCSYVGHVLLRIELIWNYSLWYRLRIIRVRVTGVEGFGALSITVAAPPPLLLYFLPQGVDSTPLLSTTLNAPKPINFNVKLSQIFWEGGTPSWPRSLDPHPCSILTTRTLRITSDFFVTLSLFMQQLIKWVILARGKAACSCFLTV